MTWEEYEKTKPKSKQKKKTLLNTIRTSINRTAIARNNLKKNNCKEILSDKQAKSQKTWTLLRVGNLKSETESFLISGQNEAIKIDYVRGKFYKRQQNIKGSLFSGRDETINHIISEYNKLTQKEYKTRQDSVGKLLHWKSCKKLNLTIWTIGICTTRNTSCRIRHKIFSRISRYKRHIWYWTDEDTKWLSGKKWICGIVDFAILVDN